MDSTGITLAILSALFMGTIGVFSRITGLPAETITFSASCSEPDSWPFFS